MSENKLNSGNRSLPAREGWGWVPDVLAVVFFVAVSVVYFLVPIRDGLVLSGS